ncbi:MAG TPA: transglutaminase-like domain-containing protein [Gemmataceae bacterium]|nr:transglutaminase-like domain-containing protein [Gemmataceae bacterium]
MDLDTTLDLLAFDPAASLDPAEIALHLARDEYPELDVEAYLSELAGMAHEARKYVRGDLAARVSGICRYLFHEMGFRGNVPDYYDPRNSYLNQVLDRRTGIPITLSVVAMAVGGRAGLNVVGIGLPGHFIAKAVDGQQEVLFDPFHGGRQLTPEECGRLVEQVTARPFQATPANLEATPLGLLVQRMLANLKTVYWRVGDFARAARVIDRIRQLAPHDVRQQRDLGVSLLQTGQAGRAIDHLAAYLRAIPDADDADAVRQLLDRARGAVAGWN